MCLLYIRTAPMNTGVVVAFPGAGVVVPGASYLQTALGVQQSLFLVASVVFLFFQASIVAFGVFFDGSLLLKIHVVLSS